MTEASPIEGPADADRLERAILKESLRHRSEGARVALLGQLVATVPLVLVLSRQVPSRNLAIWIVPTVLLAAWRASISRQTRRALEQDDERRFRHCDSSFRWSSVGMQFWVGTGVWSVAGRGAEIDLCVTLAICVFGTGAAVSIGQDYRSILISIPLLFGQGILYWLLKGADGYHISLALLSIMLLVIGGARRYQKRVSETIAIRFENDALLRQLAGEKESAVLAARQAEEANRSKTRFMAAASHDLRQPLYAITLLADTLQLHPLADPAKAIVAQQRQALDALSHMFDNLLDLSRFDCGDVQPRIATIFLPDVLAELLAEFQSLAESKRLGFEISAVEEFVASDFDLLNRLLRNLLSNAVRYTDAGQVMVRTHREGSFVTVEIVDTGCGIAPADQQRAFQEFVQLNNPARSREKGVGLGLSIVKRIAELLHHEVHLASAPGRGTTVSVRIQCAEGPIERREIGAQPPFDRAALREDAYVWIVEDDRLVRGALDTHLNALEIRHDFATNRKELERLGAESGWPDYVLLDDMLGYEETGLDLACWLVAHVPRERILLMTGNAEPGRRRVLEDSGFKVLGKPVASEDLTRWLRGGAG